YIDYHKNKLDRGFDELINIWGADHHGYIPRMKAAIQALGYPKDTLDVKVVQMVHLYEDGQRVKMSKRTGKAITLVQLMEEVGIDARRYYFIMRSADRKSTRLNSSHVSISYAVFCLKKNKQAKRAEI